MEGKKIVVVGAGPVGSLAALYASQRGAEVEVYELRDGMSPCIPYFSCSKRCNDALLLHASSNIMLFHQIYEKRKLRLSTLPSPSI